VRRISEIHPNGLRVVATTDSLNRPGHYCLDVKKTAKTKDSKIKGEGQYTCALEQWTAICCLPLLPVRESEERDREVGAAEWPKQG